MFGLVVQLLSRWFPLDHPFCGRLQANSAARRSKPCPMMGPRFRVSLLGLNTELSKHQQQELVGGATFQNFLPETLATPVRTRLFGGPTPTLHFPRGSQGNGGVSDPSSGWA